MNDATVIDASAFDGLSHVEAVRVGVAAVAALEVDWERDDERADYATALAGAAAAAARGTGPLDHNARVAADRLIASDSNWPNSIATPAWEARMAVAALRADLNAREAAGACRAALVTATRARLHDELDTWVNVVAPALRPGWAGEPAAVVELLQARWRLVDAIDAVTLMETDAA